jgi:hypothetical protein
LSRQASPFDVRRNGEPIEDVEVKSAVNPHISFSVYYSEFDAAVAAGASLDELMRLEQYPKRFRAELVAWYGYHKMIEMHGQDAATSKRT